MRNKELLVGIFAALTIVLLYVGIKFLKGSDFLSTSSKYYVVYKNVNNLAVSNPVQVSGFTVGKVSKITIMPDKGHSVMVEIDIDSEIKLSDSTKAILNSDLFGNKSIFLSLDKVGKILEPKSTIRSEVAKGMFDVITETAEPVANDMQSTLRKFNVVIDGLTKNSQRLDTILRSFQQTPGLLNSTLRNANGKITTLSGTFTEVAGNLNTTLVELRPTLKNFGVLSDSLKRMELNKTVLKTQQTLTSLNETLGRLKKGDNTMSKLMTEDTLYVNLNRLLVRMDSLIEHLNNNPKHFLGPLGQSRKKVQRDLKRQEEEKKKKQAEVRK